MKVFNVQDYEFDLTRQRVWECAGDSVEYAMPLINLPRRISLPEIASLKVTLWFLCEYASQRPGRLI
jgi:hypothetical protein